MKKEQIPNLLTIGRILFIPIFIFILTIGNSIESHIVAAIIFAVASITDYLDGYLARKWNVVSNFGKFADPMADKLLVMSAFIMLIELGMAPAWIVAVIICRELAVTGLRLLLVETGGTGFSRQQCLEKLKLSVRCLPLFSCYYIGLCLVKFYFMWPCFSLSTLAMIISRVVPMYLKGHLVRNEINN